MSSEKSGESLTLMLPEYWSLGLRGGMHSIARIKYCESNDADHKQPAFGEQNLLRIASTPDYFWSSTLVARSILRFFSSCVARSETFPSTHTASALMSSWPCVSAANSATRPAARSLQMA